MAVCVWQCGPQHQRQPIFINVVDTPHLTGLHTVFGKVTAGMDVVDAITQVPADARAMPQEPITIISIRPITGEAE